MSLSRTCASLGTPIPVVIVFLVVLVGGCFGGGTAGDTCSDEYDCEVGLRCLEVADLPSGVCTFSCKTDECPTYTQCVSTEYGPLCLKSCSAGCDQELECSAVSDLLDGVCWTGTPMSPP